MGAMHFAASLKFQLEFVAPEEDLDRAAYQKQSVLREFKKDGNNIRLKESLKSSHGWLIIRKVSLVVAIFVIAKYFLTRWS